jgi:hypothetical protein
MGALCLSNEASMVIGTNVDKEQKVPKCYRNNRMENGLAVQILLEYERVKVVAFCLSLDSLNVIQLKCSVNQQIKQMFDAGHRRRLAWVQVWLFMVRFGLNYKNQLN